MEAVGADDVDAAIEFVEAAEESLELGIDIREQLSDIGKLSKDELEAKGEFVTSQNSLVEEGILTAEDAKTRADNARNRTAAQIKSDAESNKDLKKKLDSGEVSKEDARKTAENETKASADPALQALLDELGKLNLSEDEMAKVLQDLEVGPTANAPGGPPSTVSPLTLQQESQMLIVLEDLSFEDLNGKIPSTLFMAAEKASASVFFKT